MNNELEMGFERKGPIWKIIVVAAIAAGVQFGWALQLSLLTPYVQTLGVPHTWAAIIWLCGPISGLVVQPVVGYYSDRCTSRFGRRRPFIVAGSFCISVAVFFISFAKDIGYIFGDPLDQPTKPRGIALFVFGFWILDVANNMLQGPCRAFLADLSANSHKRMQVANACFSFFMAVGNVMGYAAGSYPNLYKLLPFTKTVACDTYCANLKTCFIIDVFFLSLTISSALIFVKEQQYIKEFTKEEIEEPTEPFFKEMANAMKTTTKPMRILLLVTCLNWISWFPFLLYDTDWMGKEIYGGSVEGSAAKKSLYDKGVRAGALGLMINSIVLGFTSLGTERAGKYVGGVTTLWGGVNFILAAGLAATVWITRAAEAWRAKNGSPDVPPPADIRNSALAVFGILGVPLSVTFSVPFALASIYSADSGAGQGLSLGLLNMAIVIPQMFVSVISGPLDAVFGGGNLPAFVLGSFGATISGALAIFVLPRPKKQAYVRPTLAGGH